MPSANLHSEAASKLAGDKKNKRQKQAKQLKDGAGDKSNGRDGGPSKASKSNKSLVDELKLFQNSNLLNQQDPLEQLHQQINQLIEDDDINRRRLRISAGGQQATELADNRPRGANNAANSHQSSLSAPSMPAMQNRNQPAQQQRMEAYTPAMDFQPHQASPYYASHQEVFTVKKGVIWEQQNRERFHQRLFSRWKKRYFILTTDYLVCFKRSSSKVGRSEMGKFLYKIALTDVVKTEWMRPKRSDKGPIIMHAKNRFDLMLWAKKESDEWMMLINESIERLRIRKTIIANGNQTSHTSHMVVAPRELQIRGFRQGFYENAFASRGKNGDMDSNDNGHLAQQAARVDTLAPNMIDVADCRRPIDELTIGSSHTKASSRTSSGSRGHPNEARTPAATATTNGDAALLASSKSEPIEHGRPVDKQAPEVQADADSSSSLQRTLRTNLEQSGRPGLVPAKRSSTSRAESGAQELAQRDASTDKITISHGQSADRGAGERRHQLAPGAREPDGQERVAGRRSDRQHSRPLASLVRRDDSWHSLVSLTHVGESNMQGGQKESLHARHIIGYGANDGANAIAGQAGAQRHAINIESTATPLRAAGRLPPSRQHSIQSQSRRLPPIGLQKHAHSLDVSGPIPSSPSLHGGATQQQTTALHHQRLLQLQLLHNSNNVDYIRANNDHQIYAPDSVATTNHYGYYSMRSNLKSAASEFSFIRPNSSSFQQAHLATPMHSGPLIKREQSSGRKPLAMPLPSGQEPVRLDQNNNLPGAALNLIQPMAQPRQVYGNAFGAQITDQASGALIAPSRELPQKPNKRRQASHEQAEKNSRASGIVSFFKRAFSRRSKRRSKLVESCSSSLAAFDHNLDQIHVAQSAFSTGSKSARADRALGAGTPNGQQQQRMIDLIEAFANKTALDQPRPLQISANVAYQSSSGDSNQFASIRPKFIRDQHLGSPLHKSNSISATSGLGGLSELAIYRNQRATPAENGAAAFQAHGPIASPLITRSTKVMSANLTPLFAKKNGLDYLCDEEAISPRDMRHLPRPSSIYGQPSMIGSPVISTNARNGVAAEFGLHRNSMHAGTGHRDRFSNIDFRRQRAINGPSLDTTREVAEELSSPTSEFQRELLPTEQLYDHEINARLSYNLQDTSSLMRASKLDAYHRHRQRQAVVNPILQSPTIKTIYDNHPSANASHFSEVHQSQQQSLYDNRRGISSIHDPDRDASGYSRPQLLMPNRMNEERLNGIMNSPMIQSDQSAQLFVTHSNAFCTPTREVSRQNQLVRSATTEVNRVFVRSKPAAIVAPTTPHRQSTNLTHQFEHQPDRLAHDSHSQEQLATRFIGHQASPMRTQHAQAAPNAAVVSPIAARRSINQPQLLYQQSPLVDEQTRILKRGGRVQTTIIASDHSESNHTTGGFSKRESSLLQELNFDPCAEGEARPPPSARSDEAGALLSNNPSSRQPEGRTQTSRLSSRPNEDGSANEKGAARASATDKQSSDSDRLLERETESPSTGSRSANSSASGRSASGSSAASSSSDATETNQTESKNASEQSAAKQRRPKPTSHTRASHSSGSKRRDSSTDQTDELSSRAGSFDDHDEKNWINSKLVQ